MSGHVDPRFKQPREPREPWQQRRRSPMKRTPMARVGKPKPRRPPAPAKAVPPPAGRVLRTDLLDRSWSRWVLLRDRVCRRCGAWNGLHAHHLIRRSARWARWHTGNGIALCAVCHDWLHSHGAGGDEIAEARARWLRSDNLAGRRWLAETGGVETDNPDWPNVDLVGFDPGRLWAMVGRGAKGFDIASILTGEEGAA